MSGLLRRFRRGKPKGEEGSEPAEEVADERPSDSDIYPHPSPDSPADASDDPSPMGPVPEDEAGGEPVSTPGGIPDEIGPPPEPPVGPAAPAPPEIDAPVPDLPASAPPKLPEAAVGGTRSAHRPLTAPGHCFLCGTELSGSFCPTCRMTWNE